MSTIEEQVKQLAEQQAAFFKSADEMAKLVEKGQAERDQFGKTTEETGKQVKEFGDKLHAAQDEMSANLKDLNKRVEDVETKTNRPEFQAPSKLESFGERLVASDEYKNFAAKRKKRFEQPISFGGINELRKLEKRAAPVGPLTSGAASGGALVRPDYLDEIIMLPQRAATIRDLLGGGTTTSDTISYIQQTGRSVLYNALSAQATIGQNTLTLYSTGGITASKSYQVGTGSGAETVTVTSIDSETQVTIAYALTKNHAIDSAFMGTTYDPTAETKPKPQTNFTLEEVTQAVKTLASFIPVSRQIYDDANMMKSIIDSELLYAMMLSEEWQLLWGTGAGTDFTGIMVNANRSTYNQAAVPGQTRLDCLRRAMNVARLAEYPVSGMVLNPTDLTEIELRKGTDDHYIWVVATENNGKRLWGIPVVETTVMTQGRALVGAFMMAGAIYDRQQATIEVADQHEDWFTRNMLAVRAEERIAFVNKRPAAFVDVTFS